MATFQELRVAYEGGDWAGAAAVGAAWAGAVECSHLSQSRAQIVTDSCTAVNVCSYAGFRPTPWPHPLSCVPAGSSVRSLSRSPPTRLPPDLERRVLQCTAGLYRTGVLPAALPALSHDEVNVLEGKG